ncbi:MAG TPA: hypothetical protein VET23_10055, partial [Chitinophagaceae bacterium]|nr:hypothetical protein [Chitinophagaceae bacterium]
NVSVVENKVESKLKVGKVLNSSAAIKVAANSALTLICNQNAMFTIKKAGSYTMTQFKDSCVVSNGSMSANYARYVWEQMTNHGEGTPGSNRKMFMNTVGAVSRSVNNIWIDPRLDTVNYVSGEFPLSWKSYADANEFEFSLYKTADARQADFTTIVKKLKIPITTFINNLSPGNTYYWTAAVKGEQNDEWKVLNIVPKEKYEALLNNFKSQGPAYESAAEQAYRIAFMLEDAHFLSEAYQYYSKAAAAAPDNPLYRSTLMSFKKDYEIK